MRNCAFLFITLSIAVILNPVRAAASDCVLPSLTAEQFSKLPLDYIVIGKRPHICSGAGGLTVATRLSENANINVGVIEAGVFHHNDPLIDVPAFGGQSFGNASYDWLFETVPQVHAGGKIIQETRGKMLGGSTGINLLAWDRASKLEYDSWQSFINGSDWNFNNLLPYFIKSETVDLADNDVFPGVSKEGYAVAQKEFEVEDGFRGPVHASYNQIYGDLVLPLASTWNNLGVPTNPNTIGGDSSGVRNERTAVFGGVRSYSASAYYCPASRRKNLNVLTGTQATKLLFGAHHDLQGNFDATGVSFVSNGVSFTAKASKEIILAAGAVQTPQLLELSGIGNKTILSSLGIDTLVDLPGVGTNLQDHIYTIAQWVTLPNITTFGATSPQQSGLKSSEPSARSITLQCDLLGGTDNYLASPSNSNHTGFLTTRDSNLVFLTSNHTLFPKSDVQELISELTASLESNNNELTPLQRAQFNIQLAWLKDGSVPQGEFIGQSSGLILPANNTKYMCIISGLMASRYWWKEQRTNLPLFSIHSAEEQFTSTAPTPSHTRSLIPTISHSITVTILPDLKSLKLFANISVQVSQHQPIASLLVEQQSPPPATDLGSFVTSTFITGDHLAGTAPMASRDLGGVVDSNLKVYGTSNLRIVDASIMPLIVGAHLQATVYAIAEKAADIIRRGRFLSTRQRSEGRGDSGITAVRGGRGAHEAITEIVQKAGGKQFYGYNLTPSEIWDEHNEYVDQESSEAAAGEGWKGKALVINSQYRLRISPRLFPKVGVVPSTEYSARALAWRQLAPTPFSAYLPPPLSHISSACAERFCTDLDDMHSHYLPNQQPLCRKCTDPELKALRAELSSLRDTYVDLQDTHASLAHTSLQPISQHKSLLTKSG
ncbi:GMC oxidoreductase [Macrolepiota fuliginosa MF-IS2]|uniref:pyranose dehydrogenase (acceptor) n=1 Tax=Macrolepiota fuliginosa MF-IS2 TaxID=1400762 RepID=A0A9P5X627_9AGAR|nr:GMC oxidoreductase [Macrolepiota fuliginosa MF-IS2]